MVSSLGLVTDIADKSVFRCRNVSIRLDMEDADKSGNLPSNECSPTRDPAVG